MSFKRLAGCYEWTVVDPASGLSREISYCSSIRSTLCCCPDCGEIFVKSKTLEHHQAVRHAELGPGDTSKSMVKIIFQSSVAEDHISTIARFEQHRDSIKSRAATKKRNPRCLTDGNEVLRFYCVCNIIRNGFESRDKGY